MAAVESNPVLEEAPKERIMAKQCSLTSDGIRNSEAPQPAADFIGVPAVIASPYQSSAERPESEIPNNQPTIIRLDLEDLKCFEVVERQFQQWGITFKNAVALQPSNPAFPPYSGNTVLMGAPKNGFLEAIFQHPIRFVSGYVTSSQRTILSVYDKEDKLLTRTEMSGPNLAGSGSEIPPNFQLRISVPNIHRMTFYAFDGQLTVDDLCFGF